MYLAKNHGNLDRPLFGRQTRTFAFRIAPRARSHTSPWPTAWVNDPVFKRGLKARSIMVLGLGPYQAKPHLSLQKSTIVNRKSLFLLSASGLLWGKVRVKSSSSSRVFLCLGSSRGRDDWPQSSAAHEPIPETRADPFFDSLAIG